MADKTDNATSQDAGAKPAVPEAPVADVKTDATPAPAAPVSEAPAPEPAPETVTSAAAPESLIQHLEAAVHDAIDAAEADMVHALSPLLHSLYDMVGHLGRIDPGKVEQGLRDKLTALAKLL